MLLTAGFLLLLHNEGGMTNINDKFAFDPIGSDEPLFDNVSGPLGLLFVLKKGGMKQHRIGVLA